MRRPRSTWNAVDPGLALPADDSTPSHGLPLDLVVEQGLESIGLDASPAIRERLVRFSELVASWAPRVQLTGIRGADAIASRLVLDAAALWAAARSVLDGARRLVDLGTGAGFPGIPIAILNAETGELSVTLVESREKRSHFLRAALRELHLARVEIRRGRAESLDPTSADAVVAQAVAPPADALALMRPWCRSGGRLLLPCAYPRPVFSPPDGVCFDRWIDYRVPLGGPRRSLWTGHGASS